MCFVDLCVTLGGSPKLFLLVNNVYVEVETDGILWVSAGYAYRDPYFR